MFIDPDTAASFTGSVTVSAPGADNSPQTVTVVYTYREAGATTAPFGTIDTPGQGEVVSGTVINFGWALTPQPGVIPTDGSTIWVYVDGVPVGQPVYDQYRQDIADAFPGYANSDGAVGYYFLDTTQLANGLHTIEWLVTDDLGRAQGIGSRFFWVFNENLKVQGTPFRHCSSAGQ